MNSRIKDNLQNNTANYILPFLWMKGESEDVIRQEIEKIHESGIGAICLESRPHPDFMGEKWWADFGLVLEECKKRGMKIWILDDAHFPTGLANGLVKEKYPERARKYISIKQVDVAGPVVHGSLDIGRAMQKVFTWMDLGKPFVPPLRDEKKIICIHAHRLIEDEMISEEFIDFTEDVRDGELVIDLPAGNWRITIVHTTGDEGANPDYIHMIDHTSVSTLIEAVYEPHYEHFKEEFGKTIAGFFSDEPGFYNIFGFEMKEMIGRKMMPLPWTDELGELLAGRLGEGYADLLPYLWYPCENELSASDARHAYMDAVSGLYEEHFSKQLGTWCREHGVEYIGHVLEDNNVSPRLGCGAGHYFRAMSGQAVAGMDIIGGQIIPGMPNTIRHDFNTMDGKFFHYIETKMAASAAHFQPEKRGRLMCEAFGAYGWSFGVRNMKWLADHLISRGVNMLTPHAFSMAEYPDVDCPPHFYARGNNPEIRWFGDLMRYSNRLMHIFNEGKWLPDVGILYRAESEWAGNASYEEYIAELLHKNGIDYAIVPLDALVDKERYNSGVEDGKIVINGIPLKVLIVPGAEYLDVKLVKFAADHPDVKMIIAGEPPKGICGGLRGKMPEETELPAVELAELAAALKDWGVTGIPFELKQGSYVNVSFFRYLSSEGKEIYMIFNESLSEVIEGTVKIPASPDEAVCGYDAMKNRTYGLPYEKGEGCAYVEVSIQPWESVVLFTSDEPQMTEKACGQAPSEETDISKGWDVCIAKASDEPQFEEFGHMDELYPVSDKLPKFSGFMRYRKEIDIADADASYVLGAEHLFEAARVFVNGEEVDSRFYPPYCFDLGKSLKAGKNVIEIEVANTPLRDVLNYDQAPTGHERGIYEPSGMFGKVVLKKG